MNLFLLVLSISSFVSCDAAATWKYKKCKSDKSIATIRHFSINPDPIVLNGKHSALSLDVLLHEDIPDGAHFQISVWKVIDLLVTEVNYPVDCILPDGCFIEHCKFLGDLMGEECAFFPKDAKCGCPLKANTYKAENVTIFLPHVDHFLARGNFKMELQLFCSAHQKLLCYEFNGKIGK